MTCSRSPNQEAAGPTVEFGSRSKDRSSPKSEGVKGWGATARALAQRGEALHPTSAEGESPSFRPSVGSPTQQRQS